MAAALAATEVVERRHMRTVEDRSWRVIILAAHEPMTNIPPVPATPHHAAGSGARATNTTTADGPQQEEEDVCSSCPSPPTPGAAVPGAVRYHPRFEDSSAAAGRMLGAPTLNGTRGACERAHGGAVRAGGPAPAPLSGDAASSPPLQQRHVDPVPVPVPAAAAALAAPLPAVAQRFGVELEFVFAPSLDGNPMMLLADPFTQSVKRLRGVIEEFAMVVARRVDKQDATYTEWVITEDSSVVNFGRRAAGVEVISPILCGVSGMADAMARVAALEGVPGAVPDHCAGLHVHLNVAEYANAEIRDIVALWVFYEASFFDTLVPPERRADRCSAARSLQASCEQTIGDASITGDAAALYNHLRGIDVAESLEPLLSVTTPPVTKNLGSRRYHKVNLVHAAAHPRGDPARRIEFRSHPSTLSPLDVRYWVGLLDAFVAAAREHGGGGGPAPPPPADAFDLLASPVLRTFYEDKRRNLPEGVPPTYTWQTRDSEAFRCEARSRGHASPSP